MKNKHKDGQVYVPKMFELDTLMKIKKRIDNGESCTSIAREYGVSKSMIYRIKHHYCENSVRKRKVYSKVFKARVVEDYKNGKKVEDICNELDLAHGLIYNWIKKAGVDTGYKVIDKKRKEEFKKIYMETKKSITEISLEMGIPSGTLYFWRKKLNITTRKSTLEENKKIKLLYGRGYPVLDIMKITGMSRASIENYIKTLEG